jgi:hypothetical protein
MLGEERMPRSEIVAQGIATGKFVDGAVLEAAVKWNGGYIALVTDDIPQEDTLHIYLFDTSLNLIDSATLGAMYSTGALRDLTLESPNLLSFRFIGATTWKLEILNRMEFSVPFSGDPLGVHRPLSFARHFRLRGDPAPNF